MKKSVALMSLAAMSLAAISDIPSPNDYFPSKGSPSRSKTPLTNKQKKARAKNKLSKKSRQKNRK